MVYLNNLSSRKVTKMAMVQRENKLEMHHMSLRNQGIMTLLELIID